MVTVCMECLQNKLKSVYSPNGGLAQLKLILTIYFHNKYNISSIHTYISGQNFL